MSLITSYRFFREHAGWIVGHNAEGALDLARAEKRFDAEGGTIEWVDDDVPYDHGEMSDEEIRAKFDSNEWTGPFGCIVRLGDHDDSLWGIVLGQSGTNDDYARVVAAELASHLFAEIDAETSERSRAERVGIPTIPLRS